MDGQRIAKKIDEEDSVIHVALTHQDPVTSARLLRSHEQRRKSCATRHTKIDPKISLKKRENKLENLGQYHITKWAEPPDVTTNLH